MDFPAACNCEVRLANYLRLEADLRADLAAAERERDALRAALESVIELQADRVYESCDTYANFDEAACVARAALGAGKVKP